MGLRRLILFLIVTLLVNTGGWTFNGEAMADVLRDAQQTAADFVQSDHGAPPGDKAATPCNHWCHAIGHFVGLPSIWQVTPAPVGRERISIPAHQKITAQSDELFRPPRFNS